MAVFEAQICTVASAFATLIWSATVVKGSAAGIIRWKQIHEYIED